MLGESHSHRSNLLFILALLAWFLAVAWAIQTPPAPNSDRYDYVGRAYHETRDLGLDSMVVYPLRMTQPEANRWPPPNLTRPPLWPATLVAGLKLGLDDDSGVVFAGVLGVLLLWLLREAGDRTFGGSAGGVAALAFVSSFAATRAIWGAGPELAMALVTFALWTWSPAARGTIGYLACGTLYGVLPLLHPFAWVLALLALAARSHRYSPRGLTIIVLTMLVVGTPWYVRWALMTGSPTGFLQSQAELAKATFDPFGLGPYRTLEPITSAEVLRDHLGEVVRSTAGRIWFRLTHLDGLLSWPLLLLAALGLRRDPPLAVRDGLILGLGFVIVATVSRETRLLVPLLPVLCVWTGAGASELVRRLHGFPLLMATTLVCALPWFMPMGKSLRPGAELRDMPMDRREPPARLVNEVGQRVPPGRPFFTDSGVVAWRTRRAALLLPDRPETLRRLLQRPLLEETDTIVLTGGHDSWWLRDHRTEWSEFLRDAEVETDPERGYSIARIPGEVEELVEPPPRELREVGPNSPIESTYVPDELVEVPEPLASRPGIEITAATLEALLVMVEAAAEDGIELRVISGYRSFNYQQNLYEDAVARHGPDQRWVARPGESEHQLGTALDLADSRLQHTVEPTFAETPEGRWLRDRCGEFDFRITYTPETSLALGIEPEPWHVRFVGEPGEQP